MAEEDQGKITKDSLPPLRETVFRSAGMHEPDGGWDASATAAARGEDTQQHAPDTRRGRGLRTLPTG